MLNFIICQRVIIPAIFIIVILVLPTLKALVYLVMLMKIPRIPICNVRTHLLVRRIMSKWMLITFALLLCEFIFAIALYIGSDSLGSLSTDWEDNVGDTV